MLNKKLKKVKLVALLITVAVATNLFATQAVFADSELVTGSVTAGSTLTVTAPAGDTALSGVTASVSATGAATGSIANFTVDDGRGSGAGWTVSSTATNLGVVAASVKSRLATGSGTFTVAGVYDGLNPQAAFSGTGTKTSGEFRIVATTVSVGLPTAVTVTKADTSTANPTITANAITFNGLTVTFSGTWAANDDLRLNVDHFPYTSFTASPSQASIVVVEGNGSTNGITAQSAAVYAGAGATSSSRNDFIAALNSGMGKYTMTLGLNQVVHKYPMAGTYNSTITLTVA